MADALCPVLLAVAVYVDIRGDRVPVNAFKMIVRGFIDVYLSTQLAVMVELANAAAEHPKRRPQARTLGQDAAALKVAVLLLIAAARVDPARVPAGLAVAVQPVGVIFCRYMQAAVADGSEGIIPIAAAPYDSITVGIIVTVPLREVELVAVEFIRPCKLEFAHVKLPAVRDSGPPRQRKEN